MKQMAVSKIPYGETFRVFGDTFVALDRVDGEVLAIRRYIWKKAPFDTGCVNDLRTASITGHLVEYFLGLCKQGANEDTIPMNTIDLKATDGTREYGFFRHRAFLLTLEQYDKYQHIIPDVDNIWWWLATPYKTPAQKNGNVIFVWRVIKECLGITNCCYNSGIRPALVFAPSLLVEYGDCEGETDDSTDSEETIYNDELKIGESPLSYEAWKAKIGEQVPRLMEDDEE